MNANPATSLTTANGVGPGSVAPDKDMQAPRCLVVDSDASVRRFLSLILHGAGLNAEEFTAGETLAAALTKRPPDIIFLDVALEFSEPIQCLGELAASNYRGPIQLLSSRGAAVLAHVKNIGEQNGLQMLPAL